MMYDLLALVQLQHQTRLVYFGLLLQLHFFVFYLILVTVIYLVGPVKPVVCFLFDNDKNTFWYSNETSSFEISCNFLWFTVMILLLLQSSTD